MDKEIYEKLVESVSFIENTAQNMQTEDTVNDVNEWVWIEANARDLREQIEELDYEADYILKGNSQG